MSILERFEKQPDDVQDYDIDFTDWLTAMNDTAVSHVTSADAGITQPTPSTLSGGVVKVWLSGGAHLTTYKVTVTLTTAGRRVNQVEIKVKVRET